MKVHAEHPSLSVSKLRNFVQVIVNAKRAFASEKKREKPADPSFDSEYLLKKHLLREKRKEKEQLMAKVSLLRVFALINFCISNIHLSLSQYS